VDRDYSVANPRLTNLKDIIFEIHEEDDVVNLKKLGNLVKAKELLMFKKVVQNYSDLLFSL